MLFCPTCEATGCDRPALAGSPHCHAHLDDAANHLRRLADRIRDQEETEYLCLAGTTWSDLVLQDCRLHFCSFTGASLTDVDFSGSRLSFVYFDDAILTRCVFTRASLRNCVFGGASLDRCDFTDTELLHCNFLGVECRATDFSDSDLYSSRFISAALHDVRMTNCNLKEVHFDLRHREAADFSSSNPDEAVFGGRR